MINKHDAEVSDETKGVYYALIFKEQSDILENLLNLNFIILNIYIFKFLKFIILPMFQNVLNNISMYMLFTLSCL